METSHSPIIIIQKLHKDILIYDYINMQNKSYKKPKTKAYKNAYSNKKVDSVQDKQLQKLTKKVAKLEVEPEMKYHDALTIAQIPTIAGDLFWNLDITQGDDFDERVGEEIMLKKQEWIIHYARSPSTTIARFRVIMFMDKQVNGNPPAVLTSVSLTSGLLDNATITDTLLSPYNHRTSERYVIYHDKYYIYNPSDSLVSSRHTIRLNKNFNTKIKYAGSSNNLFELTSKNVWVVVLSEQGALTGSYDIMCRTYFTDS